jgi:hypothetical protein
VAQNVPIKWFLLLVPYSISIIIILLVGEWFYVLQNSAAVTFRAIRSGYCCEYNQDYTPATKLFGDIIQLFFQQMFTFIYEFYIKMLDEFGAANRKTNNTTEQLVKSPVKIP